jgi:alpha-beta hydrolase superfamily lysophospholipase
MLSIKETGTMRVKVNGISIEYELQGQPGRPVVTLSHSLATCMQMWGPQVAALAEHFQVLRYDMRGHGASDAPAGPYSIEMLAEDVEGLWGTRWESSSRTSPVCRSAARSGWCWRGALPNGCAG